MIQLIWKLCLTIYSGSMGKESFIQGIFSTMEEEQRRKIQKIFSRHIDLERQGIWEYTYFIKVDDNGFI